MVLEHPPVIDSPGMKISTVDAVLKTIGCLLWFPTESNFWVLSEIQILAMKLGNFSGKAISNIYFVRLSIFPMIFLVSGVHC